MFPVSGSKGKKQPICAKCGNPTRDDYGLYFPELNGQPLICSICVYRAITGIEAEWHEWVK